MIDTARMAEKIRRLLALSHSANEHEAAAAAAKAQELLHRYNLSIADVAASERPDYGREMFDIGNSAGWRGVLLNSIARHNSASVVSLGGGRYSLIGRPHVIEVCKYLYEYLSKEIDRLANEAWDNYFGYETKQRSWKTSFRFGATAAVDNTLAAQRRAQTAESEMSRSLIVRDDVALKSAVDRYYPRLSSKSVSSGRSSSGYAQGRTAGATIGIHAGVGAGAQATRQLR